MYELISKMYLHTENDVFRSRLSKVKIPNTTDRHERTHYTATFDNARNEKRYVSYYGSSQAEYKVMFVFKYHKSG